MHIPFVIALSLSSFISVMIVMWCVMKWKRQKEGGKSNTIVTKLGNVLSDRGELF